MALQCTIQFTCLVLFILYDSTEGHGQMVDPPARSVLYKYYPNRGFAANFDYVGQNCGGFNHMMTVCRGVCGVCGDPCDSPNPPNEAGGKYARGFITRTYKAGQNVNIVIEVTANHKGYFEFRLCPNNDVTKRVSHACLDQHVLQLADGSGTRVPIYSSNGTGMLTMTVVLPPGLTCSQCVLQWRMHNGNSWGYDPVKHQSCIGCGPQEQFMGCSDIAIVGDGTESTTKAPQVPVTTPSLNCKAINLWAGNSQLDHWCVTMCSKGNCPQSACLCQ